MTLLRCSSHPIARRRPASSRPRASSTTTGCASSSSSSLSASVNPPHRSRMRSSRTSSVLRYTDPASDLLRLDIKLPIVGPRRAGDGEGDPWLVPLLRGTHGVLLGVAPAIPGAFHRAFDQLEPVFVLASAWRRRQGQQLP